MPINSSDWVGDLTGTASAANALKSATTTINVSSSTAPTSGQVLIATSGTAATWQTPGVGGIANALNTTSTAVNISSSAAPPGSGYTLITTDSTHATWQPVPDIPGVNKRVLVDDFMAALFNATIPHGGSWDHSAGTTNGSYTDTTFFSPGRPGIITWSISTTTGFTKGQLFRLGGGIYDQTWVWITDNTLSASFDYRVQWGVAAEADLLATNTGAVCWRADRSFGNSNLWASAKTQGTGTVSTTISNPNVTGVGTTFTNYAAGDEFQVGANRYFIQSITNDTALVLTTNAAATVSGQAFLIAKNVDSGTSLTGSTWMKTRIVVNANLTSVDYYLNGSLVTTISNAAYLPATTTNFTAIGGAVGGGSGSKKFGLDFYSETYTFTTAR